MIRIKHVGYYWAMPNMCDKGRPTRKVYRNWVYYKWIGGSWVEITHEEWGKIAKTAHRRREKEEIRLKGQPTHKQLKELGLNQ